MRQRALDELPVFAADVRQGNVLIVNRNMVAFADQMFDQGDGRTFAQVVASGLETQAKHPDSSLAGPFDQGKSPVNLLLIAGQNRVQDGDFHVLLLRQMGNRPYVLRQA